jgi:hypothetical protein
MIAGHDRGSAAGGGRRRKRCLVVMLRRLFGRRRPRVVNNPEISSIFAHGVGSLKELWDVPCPSPTGEPFGPQGGVVPTHSAREALRALLLDVVSIQ